MTDGTIDPQAFRDFEVSGWETKADAYHHIFEPITSQVVEPLLDAAWIQPGTTTLDVGSGPGYVAGRAAARGARVVGVDIAERMVRQASSLHPEVEFRQADVESLPFDDAAFQALVGNFLAPHLGRPEQAVAELARVLAPSGWLALTTWDDPARARLLGMLLDAIELAGATAPPGLPPGPSFFRFSDEREFAALLRTAGLEDISIQTLAFTHRVSGSDALWAGLLEGTIRTGPLVLGQTRETQRRIRREFDRILEEYRVGSGAELPVSVKLACGQKSSKRQ